MNVTECIRSRRSIIDSIVADVSYSPSWKNTQITRFIAIEDSSVLGTIAEQFTPDYNSKIINQVPVLIAVTFLKGRCGFERDGSYSTKKEDRWQMFDAGIACQTFCLAAKERGLGTVIMGIFDEDGISGLLDIPSDQELAALIALGYPEEEPNPPKRKATDILLQYR